MRKRIAVVSVTILILGLVMLGYFLQKGRTTLLTDPYKAVSPKAVAVIETIDLQSFVNSLTSGQGLMGEIGKIKEFENYNRKIRFLADQLNKPACKKILSGNSALISFHLSGTGILHPLISMAVMSDVRSKQIKDILKMSGIKTINEKSIFSNEVLIMPYNINSRNDTVFISLVHGLLLCTTSEKLIRESIIQTTRDNDIRNQPGFIKVLQASGKNEDKIFLVFKNLPPLLRPFFKEERADLVQKIGKLAGCCGGDIYLSDNDLVLSGYTESTDPAQYLFKYKSATPGLFHTYKILPSATVFLKSVVNPKFTGSENSNTKAGELAQKLGSYIGEEITKAYIDIKERPIDDNSLIIYELKNRVYAEKIFLDNFSILAGSENIHYFQPDEQIKIPVYITPYKGFNSALMPGFAENFDDSWFAFYDNYMITGSSYITVSRLLYDNLLNKTLANDITYRDFESTLPSIAGYFFYSVPSHAVDYLARWLGEDLVRSLKSNMASLNKIQAVGYQFVTSNNMLYNSLSVRFREETRDESKTEWETLLDTVAAIKPFFFTNHITGAKEIFIQDMNNYAYLINAAGRVLWKVPLSERINGSVYMVDYLKNDKLQLLFSGRNYLHLLDRNGNYVERYPVRLRSPATNSLALFDYDNNRNYRLLISGDDKLVYAYDINGNVVKGWKPFRTNSQVKSEISWLRISGKDYLIISDETSVYFIDRTGNTRLTLREPVTRAAKSAIRLVAGSKPSVVCTSPDGTIQNIFFDGSVKKTALRQFSVDHSFDIFDVNGDGFGEYIFIDRGILYLYNHNGSEMFTREFGSDNLGGPINFIFSASDRKTGVFDINNDLIYLIDRNGKTMNGFPLRGASMFSIGKLSDRSGWHLIVGGTNRFLYNYKLDTEIN
ncbi:MAG: VCBS repeat-containing protein [Bacteroidia bacterium]|nr:VCBS repeat-containing protein [Bacteroidia bacterium]